MQTTTVQKNIGRPQACRVEQKKCSGANQGSGLAQGSGAMYPFDVRHGAHSEFITVTFLLAFSFRGLDSNFFIVLLESCKIFTGFAELTFFHTLADVPMNERPLSVHEVELVINS